VDVWPDKALAADPVHPPAPFRLDRRAAIESLAEWVPDGATVGVGGSGLGRKPLALVRSLIAAGRRDLTVVTLVGGVEVELLLAAGRLRRLVATYCGLEGLGLAPTFRRLRETGRLDFREWSEWTLIQALRAAAEGAPCALTPSALGTDTQREHPDWKVVPCPFTGEPLLAVPAVAPDVALLHVGVADRLGNAWAEGDPHTDRLLAEASRCVLVTAEEVWPEDGRPRLGRPLVTGAAAVAWAPGGAAPGGCAPRYRPDPEAVAALVTRPAAAVP
jgi:glutaconate CoA-transferase subunit A